MSEIRAETIWVRALSDPLRVRILRRMLHVHAAPTQLAGMWGMDVVVLRRQFRRLRELGLIARTRRRDLHGRGVYHLRDVPSTEDALWRLGAPVPARARAERLAARVSTIEPAQMSALDRLRARREQLGIERPRLARRAGIRPDMLARIERGKTDPRLSVVLVLADELDYPLERLFAGGPPHG